MTKVITYGTYDMLHYGHIRLLERAKALGDYLIVGVTADDFDKTRGKINVKQPLMERLEAVKATGIADEIIIEEYEGQKIDDIKRYDVDIFTVGSDWDGKFDYLNEYCKVVYLPRTEGVSSTEIRAEQRKTRLGLVGEVPYLRKFAKESSFVNGIEVIGVCINEQENIEKELGEFTLVTNHYEELIQGIDAVYITSHPRFHHEQIKLALEAGKHVLCESPVSLSKEKCDELFDLAERNDCILMEALKTAFSTAYSRLLLLAKSGRIGKIVSIDATCTSLQDISSMGKIRRENTWNSITAWGPTALLPVFQLLGTDYDSIDIASMVDKNEENFDLFTKINFTYKDAVASIKVGKGVKSEGELLISGTEGYIYVPAPWWKTDYFEIRYENQDDNKRYFYQLDGEGIRYEIVAFARAVESGRSNSYISREISKAISTVMEMFHNKQYYNLLGAK